MFDYGEFCPISLATSALCERWTLQIVREMVLGATRYSEFQRHMPKISPSLLKTRLRFLEDQGILIRKKIPGQRGHEYLLTPKGKAIEPILTELGRWGMYWMHEDMSEAELNAATLLRDMTAAIRPSELPSGETIIQITISDLEETPAHFIQIKDDCAELCEIDMGHDIDIYLTGSLRTLTEIWYGDMRLAQAIDEGLLKVVGSSAYTKSLPKWLGISEYSKVNRNFLES